jgi:hypothetical protein
MSGEMLNIQLKSKTGQVIQIQAMEIIAIDGIPYRPMNSVDELREHMIHLDGRVSAIESILAKEDS